MSDAAKTDTAINLLVIDSSLNDTEMYASALRNAGLAIHVNRVDSDEGVAAALDADIPDIILCSSEITGLDVVQVSQSTRAGNRDIPLIVLSANREPDLILDAMHCGARDVVARDDLEHLQLVVNREFGDLLLRRRLRALESALQETDDRCTVLIENSRDAIAYIHEGMHVRANTAYLEMFGYIDMEEIEGLPILDMVASEHHAGFKKFLRALASDSTQSAEQALSCVTSDGTSFEAVMEFSPASIDGEPCSQIIIRDQTKSKELQERLDTLTHQDLQTGLGNRQYFMQGLEAAEAGKVWENGSPAVIYVSVDHFHELRISAGISASDAVLSETAALIRDVAGEDDLLARFSDHGFTILTKAAETAAAEQVARQICETVDKHIFESATSFVSPSCSVGIAYLDGSGIGAQEITNHAIQASEVAQSEEEDASSFSVYKPSFDVPAGADAATRISQLVDFALANDRIRLTYQPIVSLGGDTTENYAVLSRLLDNEDNEVLPGEFMPVAEESGKMAEVDRWVIQHALTTLAKERGEGKKVNFFMTLSSSSMEDDSLLLWVCDCLKESRIQGQWVTFQISDTNVRSHLQKTKTLLNGLKKINCSLAIIGFGINPKSEGVLKHLPVDFVKFDSSFTEGLATSQEKQDRLNALNEMVKAHGVKSIATGVEDANSMAILWTVGVSYIQGYFLQEPTETLSYDFGT